MFNKKPNGTERLRRKGTTRLAACVVAASSLLASCLSAEEQQGFAALNTDRVERSLPPLEFNEMLQTKAERWAKHLAAIGALEHSVLADDISGCWRSLGENVGYGSSVATVEDAFMNSPAHRANILEPSYSVVAVGVAEKNQQKFVVQEFMQQC